MAIESVGVSIISKIAGVLVEPAINQFRYMFCFNSFVEEFNERKQKLDSELDRLQNAVQVAQRKAEEIEKDVKKWLEDTTKAIDHEDVKHLENEIRKNDNCFTCCPNCMRQFKLSKALAKKSDTFRKLEEISKTFKTVSHRGHPQPIEFLPSKEFTPSKSSKEAFKQIMEALKDDNFNMIGLYGMGGVGKTTLVKEVGRRAKESQLFDEVLMATVSQNPDVRDIQNQMADKLGLDFKEKSNAGRAARLWLRLEEVEKMLIILDDVWRVIDFQEIGIPLGDGHRGCKILLTTRVQGICSYMECRKKVRLSPLPEKEAWDLFRSNAGLRDGDSTSTTVAREVARECQGLPIALVTVGKALRDKSEVEWEVAFTQLKNSQFPDMEYIDERRTAYACLKLSYDYLRSEETKLCFLICCLFPEDYNIPIEDLTRYAVGYELNQDVESIGDAKKGVYVEIKKLKDCCMLLDTENDEHVKMHDLVRDVAIRIASSKEYGFMVKAGIGLKKWPMSNTGFEAFTTISLMGNKLTELPEGLECPQLKVLLLELDDGMNVPEKFFEGMKEIEVLSLKGGCLSLQSLELSTELQSLVLTECECKDLIWLRKLQSLKILGLMWCLSIEELPDEIGELKELRLLDVTGCKKLSRIPVNLIGRLKKLEELLIGDGSFQGWDAVGCDSTGGMNASLTELNSLSQLAVLSLTIPKVECIPRDFVFPDSLRKYDIILGNAFGYGYCPSTSTRLYWGGTSLNAKTFEQLFLHKLESVVVRGCGDVFTLFPARLRQGLKNLKELTVESCESLEEVFELGEADEGSSEEKELKCIWKGPTEHVSLQSLNFLELYCLHKLTFIFTASLAQSLPKLERLDIRNCGELKHIIREENGEREIIPESPYFPQLKTLKIKECGKLEYVFPVSLSPNRDGIIKFPQLRKLSLHLGPNYSFLAPRNFDAQLPLKKLTIEGHEEVGNWLAQLQQNGFLQRLESVQVDDCGDVRAPFPAKLLRALNNLRRVSISTCKSLEEVFELGEPDEGSSEEKELLSSLTLSELPELKCIWKGPTRHVSLQSLAYLSLNSLDKLTFIFTPSITYSLPKLESLRISKCCELKHIIREEDGEREIIPESPHFPKLKTISIGGCGKLEYVFPVSLSLTLQSLPKLESLGISECGELKHIIREKDGEREIIPESPCFPQLKTIYISKCGKLEYVLPVSVSPSLRNLEMMRIFEAHNLKQIFYGVEGDALTRDAIIKFPKLRELSILNCSFFGPKNFVAQLPYLPILRIDGRKELGNLSAQLQGLTNLETLHLQHLPDTRCVLKGLVLSKLTTLEMAAHGQQSGSLQRLHNVHMYDCGDVRAPFPAKLLRALNNLRLGVSIFTCKSLEEVFELGEADEGSSEEKELLSSLTGLHLLGLPELKCIWKGPTRHVSLQSLNILRVDSLDKLPFIFTPSLAQSLPKLAGLYINNCAELQHIIREEAGEREIIPESPGQDDQASPINVEKEMVLPNLRELSIQQLSSIVCFSFGWCDYFLFPRLEKLKVHQCPKLTTKFATTPDGSMSAHSEVSEVAEDSSINREWTRNKGWKEV